MPVSLRTKINAGFAAAMLVLAVFAILSYRSTLKLLGTVDQVSLAEESIGDVRAVLSNLNAARGTIRGFYITGDSNVLPAFNSSLHEAYSSLNRLKNRSFYPNYDTDIDSLEGMLTHRVGIFDARLRAFASGGLASVRNTMNGDADDRQINAQARAIEERIRLNLVRQENEVSRFSRLVILIIALGGILTVLFLMIAGGIIYREIAHRNDAFRQLGEREDRLEDLVDNAAELIQLVTPDGRITNVNYAWMNVLGYRRENLDHLDIVDIVHPDHRERWIAAVEETLDGKTVREFGVDFVTKDGSRVNLIGNLSCRFTDGRPDAIRGIFRDVTELREQEHRNEQFLEGIPIGVFVVDGNGTPVYANSAAAAILGRAIEAPDEKAEDIPELYGVYCAGTNERYPANRIPVVRALRGENVFVNDLEIQNGERRVPVEVTAAPIYASSGEITGAVAAFSDISARREVEKLKDELISVVSHELRTPLTSIRGALGLVGTGRLGQLNEQGRKLIDIATMDTDRLVRLINDMLDIERMESGRIEMHKTTSDSADLIEQTIHAIQPIAQKSQVQLARSGASARVWCDADRIVQTLTNLVGNAIKFSPKDGTVTISAIERETEIEFRVTDQGRGIPKEKIETIFERFQQVDASDAREKGGAGLGLAISRSIVAQHGGRIWAESDGEHGSTFAFTLPRMTQVTEAEAATSDSDILLLVAEDDSTAAEVLRAMLQDDGYRVAVAGNGRDAVDMAVRLQPSIILLDIVMPEMNGWEAMAELKQNPRTADIPIVVVSALSEQQKGEHDAVTWIEKPFDATRLRDALLAGFKSRETPRVLIVEDDANLTVVLTTHFEELGMKTMHAANGKDAIRIAQEEKPDLLVLDLMLPEKDGFDVVEWFKQHEQLRHMPLVVYTALELADIQKQRLSLGPSVFMTKSREQPGEVAARVAQLLHHVRPKTRTDTE